MNQKTRGIIETVERYAKRQFRYRNEIGILLQASGNRGMDLEFENLAFIGKFIKNAHTILTRDNLGSEVTIRLADELRVNLEKSIRTITAMIEKLPPEEKNLIAGQFLSLTRDNMDNLLDLMTELSWFKNYSLDNANA